ncbi:MAG TPA: flagellar motor stator protein MotA [Candidatus Binatia bacterium]|nr:flagellar motor stator protein MotA [Candidatus Binatia bacterium]
MFAIVGILVVLGAVIGGFLMEHGPIRVLLQPSEAIIICGAALGTLLVANPLHTLKGVVRGVVQVIRGSTFTGRRYLDALKMMYEMFNKIRREGPNSVENDIEEPEKSKFFAAFPGFVGDRVARDFVCDTMRMALMGGVEPFDVDQMIEADMDVHARQSEQSVTALSSVADSLPGLGIVAAVLGVVMTMSALGGPPEEIGRKVAAALVGTFLGILMCYGVVGPISSNLAKLAHEQHEYLHVLRVTMIAFMKGIAPLLAVEMGRRAIPAHLRPSFAEFEKHCKQSAAPAAAEPEAAPAAAEAEASPAAS